MSFTLPSIGLSGPQGRAGGGISAKKLQESITRLEAALALLSPDQAEALKLAGAIEEIKRAFELINNGQLKTIDGNEIFGTGNIAVGNTNAPYDVIDTEDPELTIAITPLLAHETYYHCSAPLRHLTISECASVRKEVLVVFRTGAVVEDLLSIPAVMKYIGDIDIRPNELYALSIFDGILVLGGINTTDAI